jgi:hypothetical protein
VGQASRRRLARTGRGTGRHRWAGGAHNGAHPWRDTQHRRTRFGEALRGPGLDVDEHTDSPSGWRGAELSRVTPAIAEKLRAMAAAAQAFTDTLSRGLGPQGYSFDPKYQPVEADELE